jgi:glucokinase
MCLAVNQAIQGAQLTVAAIGIAVPGPLDIPAGLMLNPPNLKPWQNVPVRDHLASTFGLPCVFQNDANAAAYGELWAGAGQGARSLVLFTLGTGIGGGIVVDGRLLDGRHSHGGELGHTRIELTNPRSCSCGQAGCLEAYASATAVATRTREILRSQCIPSCLQALLDAGGELSARDVFEAAVGGDELASRIVDETAYYLAIGAVNAMHTLDPDMILFAGGMIIAGDTLLEKIRRYIRKLAFPIPAARTSVAFAKLGADAGMIGAAGLALRYLDEKQSTAGRI